IAAGLNLKHAYDSPTPTRDLVVEIGKAKRSSRSRRVRGKPISGRRLPKMKGGVYVSTVSSVGRPDPGAMAVVSSCTDRPQRPCVRPGIVIIVVAADGADGIFGPRMNPDHPGSSSAFTTEGNVDT